MVLLLSYTPCHIDRVALKNIAVVVVVVVVRNRDISISAVKGNLKTTDQRQKLSKYFDMTSSDCSISTKQ